MRDLARLRATIGPIAGAGMLAGLLATTWTGLWRDAPIGTLAAVTVAGIAPALVRVSGLRRSGMLATLASVVAAIVILAASVHANPLQLVSGDGETWSALGAIIPDGLGNAAATPLPLAVEDTAPLSALLVVVLGGAAALIGWQGVVARRPLAAVIATATGLAYRWTLIPPRQSVVTGLIALAIALGAFRLCRRAVGHRPVPGRAVAGGALVLAIAMLGSIGADRAPAAWWDWRNWTFGTGTPARSLSLEQNYGPLEYPDEPILIARVEAKEGVPLRAITLETFNGRSFSGSAETAGERTIGGELRLDADRRGDTRRIQQTITIGSTRSAPLLAGGRPVRVSGLGRRTATLFADGSVRLQPGLAPKAEYEVETLIPDPGAAALAAAPNPTGVDKRLLTLTLDGGQTVTVPAWGSGLPAPDPDEFGQYRGVYELSREVIGDAPSMYGAVNRIESWLWRELRYDVTVESPVGNPPLVDFLLDTKRGYCQHFAGSMALMLRMNGIPARVAVGFTYDSARFDRLKSSYEIIDRDAHSWVEVEFPGYGWIPFDPTPGRAVPNTASVSSPNYSDGGIAIEDPGVSTETANPVTPADRAELEPRIPEDSGAIAEPSSGWSWWWVAAILAGLAIPAPFVLKAIRRRRRRRGGERERVLGAARELESFLTDLGRPPDVAATPSERSALVWRDLGFDARPLYRLATEARFGPVAPPPGSARKAWRAVRAAKRSQGWRRRLAAALRLRSLRPGVD